MSNQFIIILSILRSSCQFSRIKWKMMFSEEDAVKNHFWEKYEDFEGGKTNKCWSVEGRL